MSLYDFFFSRRAGGDPTQAPDMTGARAITYDNPGYREGDHSELSREVFDLLRVLIFFIFVLIFRSWNIDDGSVG